MKLAQSTLLLFSCLILLSSCSTSSTIKDPTHGIELSGEIDEDLIGIWEAEELGDYLIQSNYSLPARFVFQKKQSFSWEIYLAGKRMLYEGTFNPPKSEDNFYSLRLNLLKKNSQDSPETWNALCRMANQRLEIILFPGSSQNPASFNFFSRQIYRKVSQAP